MNRLTFFLLRSTSFLFSLLSFQMVYGVSNVVCLFLSRIVRYRRKIVLGNLVKSFPEKSPNEIDCIANAYYRHLCDLIVESIKGLTITKPRLHERFVYKNPNIFDPFYDKNKSIILLGSHFGNWEWGSLSFPLAVRHKVIGIYKPINNKVVENYLNACRKRWGLHLVNMKNAGRAILQHKGQPIMLVLIADQSPANIKHAQWVNFLHQDTPFLHGAEKIARQTGFPVFHYKIKKTVLLQHTISQL